MTRARGAGIHADAKGQLFAVVWIDGPFTMYADPRYSGWYWAYALSATGDKVKDYPSHNAGNWEGPFQTDHAAYDDATGAD